MIGCVDIESCGPCGGARGGLGELLKSHLERKGGGFSTAPTTVEPTTTPIVDASNAKTTRRAVAALNPTVDAMVGRYCRRVTRGRAEGHRGGQSGGAREEDQKAE